MKALLLTSVLALSTILASNIGTEVKALTPARVNLENSDSSVAGENSEANTEEDKNVFSPKEFFKDKADKLKDFGGFNFKGGRGIMGLSEYEQYGLAYSEELDGWAYDGKLVNVFLDNIQCTNCNRDERNILCLNKNGEINIKTIRDETGALLGLAEMTEEEYNQYLAEEEARRAEIEEKMGDIMGKMQERIAQFKDSMQFELPESFTDAISDITSSATMSSLMGTQDI